MNRVGREGKEEALILARIVLEGLPGKELLNVGAKEQVSFPMQRRGK